MSVLHPLKKIIENHKQGIPVGVCSICSANEYVIEAAMEKAGTAGGIVLIEATANQVNQFGGYTGMKPDDFRHFVFSIAEKISFPKEQVILGGDHLGPLTWKNEDSGTAMEKASELIRQYVFAGFTKIHIDTSMHLGDDNSKVMPDTGVIADRGARLCFEAEKAFNVLKKGKPESLHPVYVIGSEVPIPGGSQKEEDEIRVTKAADLEETVGAFKAAFLKLGLEEAWNDVVAVVVQPGVEFGDEVIHEYDRSAATDISRALKNYPGLVFEGHSTDYQTADALKKMVEDGIAVLKVGPALTFALREALFALNHMENELFKFNSDINLSGFMETLDSAMLQQPDNWRKHYHGDEAKVSFARKYSFSDRCRYYLPHPGVRKSLEQLLSNLRSVDIPLTLISQFMPVQYVKICKGELENKPEALLKDRVANMLDNYYFAIMP